MLDTLQEIEQELGRERLVPKGPRSIDLDILLYGDRQTESERLQVPHPLMLEREFVLRPLADVIPQGRLPPPFDGAAVAEHLSRLLKEQSVNGKGIVPPPQYVTNFAPHLPAIRSSDPARSTSIMAVLNVTPDSFSDGGQFDSTNASGIQAATDRFVAQGASIIDVGGQSTRPGASPVTTGEEISRVVPAIQAIRAANSTVAISVDTFSSTVAEAAIKVGADIVNDVSGGTRDPKLLSVVARHNKTIILMHTRGDSKTMTKMTDYPDGVITSVGREMKSCITAALAAGIPRWRIILDPGIGFAKTATQNLELLGRLDDLRHFPGLEGFPWMVGSSRKKFVAKITDAKDIKDRRWGQAAAVTASVRGGADVVREHDVGEMSRVVRMAEAIFRNRSEDLSQTKAVEDQSPVT